MHCLNFDTQDIMGAYTTLNPVVSKFFCSSLQAVLLVRRRPPTVTGGGFVVTDREQRVVFSVDGCGIIGASGQLVVRDGDGTAILFIYKKVISSCIDQARVIY
jgi:hypothetical protein